MYPLNKSGQINCSIAVLDRLLKETLRERRAAGDQMKYIRGRGNPAPTGFVISTVAD
jgi:hypothetical protein